MPGLWSVDGNLGITISAVQSLGVPSEGVRSAPGWATILEDLIYQFGVKKAALWILENT